MLKFYIEVSFIWFIITICFSIITREELLKNIKKFNNGQVIKKNRYIKTIINDFIISFIPVFRLFILIATFMIVFCPEIIIEKLKKNGGNK